MPTWKSVTEYLDPMAVLLVGTVLGSVFWLGTTTGDDVTWHSGVAEVARTPKSATLCSPDCTGDTSLSVGVQGGVSQWVDDRGEMQQGGWPSCLEPPLEGFSQQVALPRVRFATVDVDRDEVADRDGEEESLGTAPMAVVVDCRG